MALRIVALVLILGLAAFVFTKQQAADAGSEMVDGVSVPKMSPPTHSEAPGFIKQGVASEGVRPEGEPEFDVSVELEMKGEQPNLYFTITERHGWYAGTVTVEFWHVAPAEDGGLVEGESRLSHLCHNYLDFNATLVCQTVPNPHEFPELDEDWGTSENWQARILGHGEIYQKNED